MLTADLLALSAFAENKTSVVLVHGAFADGSSWNKVITRLQKHHTEVIAVSLPLTSLKMTLRPPSAPSPVLRGTSCWSVTPGVAP